MGFQKGHVELGKTEIKTVIRQVKEEQIYMQKDGQIIKLENQAIFQFTKTNLIHVNVINQELNTTNVLIETIKTNKIRLKNICCI